MQGDPRDPLKSLRRAGGALAVIGAIYLSIGLVWVAGLLYVEGGPTISSWEDLLLICLLMVPAVPGVLFLALARLIRRRPWARIVAMVIAGLSALAILIPIGYLVRRVGPHDLLRGDNWEASGMFVVFVVLMAYHVWMFIHLSRCLTAVAEPQGFEPIAIGVLRPVQPLPADRPAHT